MKTRIDFGKYFIRFIGSVCILAAIALLVMAPIIRIDGVKAKEYRSAYAKVEEMIKVEETWLLDAVERTNSPERDDLEDNKLPYKKADLKEWFGNINDIAKEALNDNISLKEVGVLIWNAPKLAKDIERLGETDLILYNAINHLIRHDPSTYGGRNLHTNLRDAAENAGVIQLYGYLAIAVIALLGLLGVDAVIGNLRDKRRGGKYILLAITIAITVGGYVGFPFLSKLLQEILHEIKPLEDIELRLTIVPVLSSLLLIASVMTDRWNKKRTKKAMKKAEEKGVTEAAEPVVQPQHIAETPVAQPQPVVEMQVEESVQPVEEEPAEVAEPIIHEAPAANREPAEPEKKVKREFPKIQIKLPKNGVLKKAAEKIWEKKRYIGIGAAAIAAVAAVVVLIAVTTNTYKTPVRVLQRQANNKKFTTSYHQGQDQLNGLLKKEVTEILDIWEESGYYEDMMEEWEESFEDSIEDMKDEYGSNYKYTYKIVEKEELKKADLRKFRDGLRNIGDMCEEMEEEMEDLDYDDWEDIADDLDLSKSKTKALFRAMVSMGEACKKAKVTKGYELTIEVKLTGSELDEAEESEITIFVYKVDGRWIAANAFSLLESIPYF